MKLSWRIKARAAGLFCLGLALLTMKFAGPDLMHLIDGLHARRPLISSAQHLFAILCLIPFSLSVGLIFLFSKQATPDQMKNVSARTVRWSQRYMIFMVVSIGAALVAPIVQFWVVDDLARRRGYVSCPTPGWPRHQPDRWALPGAHGPTERCPGEGADPNV